MMNLHRSWPNGMQNQEIPLHGWWLNAPKMHLLEKSSSCPEILSSFHLRSQAVNPWYWTMQDLCFPTILSDVFHQCRSQNVTILSPISRVNSSNGTKPRHPWGLVWVVGGHRSTHRHGYLGRCHDVLKKNIKSTMDLWFHHHWRWHLVTLTNDVCIHIYMYMHMYI